MPTGDGVAPFRQNTTERIKSTISLRHWPDETKLGLRPWTQAAEVAPTVDIHIPPVDLNVRRMGGGVPGQGEGDLTLLLSKQLRRDPLPSAAGVRLSGLPMSGRRCLYVPSAPISSLSRGLTIVPAHQAASAAQTLLFCSKSHCAMSRQAQNRATQPSRS